MNSKGENHMIVTTTNAVQGMEIKKYLGVVSGECVLGTGAFSEIFARASDILGEESIEFRDKLKEATKNALSNMQMEASKINADAIVGVNIDINVNISNMFIVSAIGTAVLLKGNETEPHEKKSKNVWITNYYSDIPIRLETAIISVNLKNEKSAINLSGMNYGTQKIQAIRADIDFITIFDDLICEKDLALDVINEDNGKITTPEHELKLHTNDFERIKAAKIHIKCYVIDGKSVNVEQSTYKEIETDDIDAKKEKYGTGYFSDSEEFDGLWKCICGHINPNDSVCKICGRSFSKISSGVDRYAHLYELAAKKSNAIEIYELYREYLSNNPSNEMEPHLEKLKTLASNERLYGNRKKAALKYIEENIFEQLTTEVKK